MKIVFTFDTEDYDLTGTHLARIMLDIQHLAIVCVALANGSLESDDVVFDDYLRHYKGMVEAKTNQLDNSEVSIVRLKMESPLEVGVALKKLSKVATKPVADAFRFIINKVFFVDLEREKKSLENALMREEITQKKIKNASQALDLAKKIPNSYLRAQFIESLTSSVMPFELDHPPLKSVKVIEDD